MRKIVITGASGFVGSLIIPTLISHKDITLVLVSRFPEKLAQLYPKLWVVGYEDLEPAAKSADLLVNMATLNNDHESSKEDFLNTNFLFVKELYDLSEKVGVKLFCQISTIKVLDQTDRSDYSTSKAEADKWLLEKSKSLNNLEIIILRLGPVYGKEKFSGKLSILTMLPPFLRPLTINILSAFFPITNGRFITEAILKAIESQTSENRIITNHQSKNVLYRLSKFFIDFGFSFFILVFLSWLLLIVFIAIKLTSRGPGLFIQNRVGKDGKIFKCIKFRTMHINSPEVGTHEISQSAVTPLGKFLRKTKIDELPQIINILLFEMSLVGPRPCLPVQKVLINERSKRGVLNVLPGITGLAQVSGVDMSDPLKLAKLDTEYLELRSIVLDLHLILKTCIGSGYGDPTDKNR